MKKPVFAEDEAYAVAKYVVMAPSKIRRVLLQIKGKPYYEALSILEYLPYSASQVVIKVLRSACANALARGLSESRLKVKTAFVDQCSTLRRLRYRARGRACKIFVRTSAVTIVVKSSVNFHI